MNIPTQPPESLQTPRWQRLQDYFDERPQFVDRLMSRLGWSRARSMRALAEYQRFCWLAAEAGHVVSPSEIVDQVWHLHLQHTRDYWQHFCPQILGRELHHDPAEPGLAGRERHAAQYAGTLASYRRYFGIPDPAFWPTLHRQPRRWNWSGLSWRPIAGQAGLLVLLVIPAAMAAPLDWSGPRAPALFVALALLSVPVALGLRRRARGATVAAGQPLPPTLHLAYLAGGAERCMDAAVAELLSCGILRLNENGGLWPDAAAVEVEMQREVPLALPVPLRRVVEAIRGETRPGMRVVRRLNAALEPIPGEMQRDGLLLDARAAWRTRLLSALVPAVLLVLGVAQLRGAQAGGWSVAILAFTCILLALFIMVLLRKRPHRSRLGDALLAQTRGRYRQPQRPPTPGAKTGVAVALFGTAVLAGTAYARYHELRREADALRGGGGGGGCGG